MKRFYEGMFRGGLRPGRSLCEPLSWTCAERCAGRLHITGQGSVSGRVAVTLTR
jgi:hypothetical protein